MRAYLYLARTAFTPEEFGSFVDEIYDGSWLADYRRASFSTIDGTVYVDYLGDCGQNETERLTEEEISIATLDLGVRPQTMLIIGISSHHAESGQLASVVVRDFQSKWGGSIFDDEMASSSIEELVMPGPSQPELEKSICNPIETLRNHLI